MNSQDTRVAQLEAKVAQLEAQLRQQQSRGHWQQQQQQQPLSDHQGWKPWQQQQQQKQLDIFGRGERTMASRSLHASAPQTRPRPPISVTSPSSPFANSPLLPFEVCCMR